MPSSRLPIGRDTALSDEQGYNKGIFFLNYSGTNRAWEIPASEGNGWEGKGRNTEQQQNILKKSGKNYDESGVALRLQLPNNRTNVLEPISIKTKSSLSRAGLDL